MGYNITMTDGNVIIPGKHLDAAYAACVELNNNDALKSGGRYPAQEWDRSTEKWNPNRWFSWMPHDWPDKYKTLRAVFEALGFMVEGSPEDGGIMLVGYDSKSGDEEVFLRAIAPYVLPSCYIDWHGEDGMNWRFKFDGEDLGIKDLILVERD